MGGTCLGRWRSWVQIPLAPLQSCPFNRSHSDILYKLKDMQSTTKSNNTATTIKEEEDEEQNQLSSYTMFKYSIRSELTRKYYERRLRTFFDFIQFEIEIKDVEIRCNHFAERERSTLIGN